MKYIPSLLLSFFLLSGISRLLAQNKPTEPQTQTTKPGTQTILPKTQATKSGTQATEPGAKEPGTLLRTLTKSSGTQFNLPLTSPIPMDSAVRSGVLPNGLRYYIRRNREPRNRAELRLVVHAGSMEEDADQQGMAHFVEHMCFRGTRNFPKAELVSFMERAGLRFGADLNASTSYDQTVYQLSLPTDSSRLNNNTETIFHRGFQVLEDWAHLVTFNSQDIDNERGVVTEEWRLGRGANARMRDTYFPVILKGSRYATHIPIGTSESIKTSSYAAIKRFYADWYRPDLMAVVAVGDFDVNKVEALIKAHFGKLKNPVAERTHLIYPVTPNKEPLVSIVTDKEQPYSIALLYYKQPKAADLVLADLRAATCRSLFNQLLDSRIMEKLQQSSPPFLYGSSTYGSFIGNLDAFQCIAVAKSAETIGSTIASLLDENERVRKYGFQAAELSRAKSTLLAAVEKSFQEQNKTSSVSFTNEYIDNFIYPGSLPSAKFTYAFERRYLPGITLAELNSLATRFTAHENRLAVIMAPDKDAAKLPDEKTLLSILDKKDPDLKAYIDDAVTRPLVADNLIAGRVTSEKLLPAAGITSLQLSNGMRVLIKPTLFKNNEILIDAWAPGGTSVYPESNFRNAFFAADIAGVSGAGDFSSIQLDKALAGKTVSVTPYIGTYEQGIGGSTSREGLETALQLMHLYFSTPRRDTAAFSSFIVRQSGSVANQSVDPGYIFADSCKAIMSSNNKRELLPELADIQGLNADSAAHIYHDRFKDAGAFTVILVGNLDLKLVRSMLEKYLGSLPSTGNGETWKDDQKEDPRPRDIIIHKGTENKSQVRIFYTGAHAYSSALDEQLVLLTSAMDFPLRESLREKIGGTYGVSIDGGVVKIPKGKFAIEISFGCAPENVQKLTQAALAVVEEVKAKGISPAVLAKVKAASRREHQLNIRQNSYWLQELSQRTFNSENPEDILKDGMAAQLVTVEDTRKLANEFFTDSHKVTISLIPESAAAKP